MSLPADDLLSAFHDGELNSAERATVEQRLATSVEARRELSEIRQVSSLLKELPRERLPSELPQQVLQAIEREMLIPSQRDAEAGVRSQVAANSAGSSRRWVGVVAVLTSAAGLLLLVRAIDDQSHSNVAQVRNEDVALRKQVAVADTSPDTSAAGGAASAPMAAKAPASDFRNSGASGGAAGTDAPVSASSPLSRVAVPESDVLFFDQSTLRDAKIGDVVRAMQTEGSEVAVVWLTVVDRQEGLAGLQLLLGKNRIARADADKKSDRAEKPNAVADQMHAVFVESDAEQLTAALKQLRETKFLQSLEVDQPIELAQLDEVRAGLEASSLNRRVGTPAPSAAEKKIASATSTPKVADKAKSELAGAKEAQDSKDQLAKQVTLEFPRGALVQNQANQQTRNRGLPRNMPRAKSADDKNADQVPAEQRPMQVLFVVVDQSQSGKPPVSPSNSSKPTTTPSKARSEPAKPVDKDGAA